LQFGIDVDDPHSRVVLQVTDVGDECRAQHRLGLLDGDRVATRSRLNGPGEVPDIVTARIEIVGRRRAEKLDELLGGRTGARRKPQGRSAAIAIKGRYA